MESPLQRSNSLRSSELRYEATGEHLAPSEQGLTIASCIQDEPQQMSAEALGLFQEMEGMEENQKEVGMVDEVLADGSHTDRQG